MDKNFQDFLNKKYSHPNFTNWNRWILKFVEPAFDEPRHEEMVQNFGYSEIKNHDFEQQYKLYNELKNEKKLDEETKKFIGFLAGNGFFKKWSISLDDWLNMSNWINPYWNTPTRKTINQLLTYKNGLNCFKLELLEMPHWKR